MSTDNPAFASFDQPPLRNRLNFFAKRLRFAGKSYLRISKREAAELSALLTEAEGELGRQDELIALKCRIINSLEGEIDADDTADDTWTTERERGLED